MRSVRSGGIDATRALIAINVIAFLAEGSFTVSNGAGNGTVVSNGELYRAAIANNHEYWRLITSGFLHAGLLHIAFNMYLLYVLGQMLEPALGRLRFVAVYFTALLAGSFGALVATPGASIGASGAVFGLMGAAVVEMRARGINPWQSGIPLLIILNLVLSLAPGISIGAHVGGLIGGVLAAYLINLADRHTRRPLAVSLVGCLALSVLAVAGALAVAGSTGSGVAL
jgi:membrane associated rhomboid family serine protease